MHIHTYTATEKFNQQKNIKTKKNIPRSVENPVSSGTKEKVQLAKQDEDDPE